MRAWPIRYILSLQAMDLAMGDPIDCALQVHHFASDFEYI